MVINPLSLFECVLPARGWADPSACQPLVSERPIPPVPSGESLCVVFTSAPPFLSPSLLASVPRAWWSPPPTRAAGRAPVSPPLWLSRCRLQRAPRPSPTPYPRVRNLPAPHPHGTYAASPHPGHLVPSAYASCLICLICPFATGPFAIFPLPRGALRFIFLSDDKPRRSPQRVIFLSPLRYLLSVICLPPSCVSVP